MNINKLILKSLNKTTSLEEFNALEAWKNESNENLEFLKAMQEEHNSVNYKDFNKEQAWNNINSHLNQPIKKIAWAKWGIAAAILLLLSAGSYFYASNENIPSLFKTQNTIQNYALVDNSEIWLNTNSEVQYLSDFKTERKVSLSGEAFFDVKANKDNPFIIELNSSDFIKVVGTSFNVVNRDDEFDLTVYSGKVEFHALKRVINLTKGDRIVKVNGSFTKIRNTDKNVSSWKNKELIFDNILLNKALTQIGKHYSVKIKLDKSIDISKCYLRSKYTQESITDVMLELSKFFVMEYKQSESTILISKLKCN